MRLSSLRSLIRRPLLGALAVLAIGIGIGATTTVYSITSSFLRELPVPDAERVLYVTRASERDRDADRQLGQREWAFLRDAQGSLRALAAFQVRSFSLFGAEGRPERHSGARISPSGLAMLGVQPTLGRLLADDDARPGAERVVLLGRQLWRNRFGADSAIVGRQVRLNGAPATVVGVMPEGFRFPFDEDLWVPFRADADALAAGGGAPVSAFGRLRDGVSLPEARSELEALVARLRARWPDANEEAVARVVPFHAQDIEPEDRTTFRAMVAVVGFVLLIACANVANLLMARATRRRRELAVRSALGASRRRLMGGLLAETLVLAALGGGLGVGLAYAGVAWFDRAIGDAIPNFWMAVHIDPPVLLFASGLVLLATLAAGLVPALRASAVDIAAVLREGVGGTGLRLGRLSRALVVGEIALSCALLVVAGLMVKGVLDRTGEGPRFPADEILVAGIELREAPYPDADARTRFVRELIAALEGQPGVRAAAVSTVTPGLGGPSTALRTAGAEGPAPTVDRAAATPELFGLLGIAPIEGRLFDGGAVRSGERVVLVNRALADRFFPEGRAVGRSLRLGSDDDDATVIGVVPALRERPGADRRPMVYLPYSRSAEPVLRVLVRVDGAPLAFLPRLRETVADLDPDLPLFGIDSAAGALEEANAAARTFARLFLLFGLAALLLASVGLYGVMTFAVRSRFREIGIRIALGATGGRVLWTVLRGGVLQIAGGAAAGLLVAAAIAPALRRILFDVSPWYWPVYGLVALSLVAVGLVAAALPARQATRADPVLAMRQE